MKQSIKLQNKDVQYELKVSKRAKRMRLAIYCDGTFVVTKPYNLSEDRLLHFIKQKTNWILSKLETFSSKKRIFIVNNKNHYIDNKEKAKFFVVEELKQINKHYKFKYNKINIRNQKTRWGSCSKKGNLNFNYRILFLPKDVAKYIIAHELCHLKQFNHSRKFWQLVEQTIPNYIELRKKLKI
jgi:predicted metal-dependent hydrolase